MWLRSYKLWGRNIHIFCINLVTEEIGIGKLLLNTRGPGEDDFADWDLTSSQLLRYGIGIDLVQSLWATGAACQPQQM